MTKQPTPSAEVSPEHTAWLAWADYTSKKECEIIAQFRRENRHRIHIEDLSAHAEAHAKQILSTDETAAELYAAWQQHLTTAH